MRLRNIIKMFENGNVCVTGLRGTGKDVLFGNVIIRRKKPYLSNLDYGGNFNPLILKDFNINNKYSNFISHDVNRWVFQFPYGTDLYISDVGVYFPSQYCNKLNNEYEGFVYYQALSRQVSHNNVHCNVQNLNRCWDKIREQSDTYIRCVFCKVVFGFVIQKVVLYDKYQSCLDRVGVCRVKKPNLFMNKNQRLQRELYLDNYRNQHGSISAKWLVYKNKSKHDTYYFEKLLKKEI